MKSLARKFLDGWMRSIAIVVAILVLVPIAAVSGLTPAQRLLWMAGANSSTPVATPQNFLCGLSGSQTVCPASIVGGAGTVTCTQGSGNSSNCVFPLSFVPPLYWDGSGGGGGGGCGQASASTAGGAGGGVGQSAVLEPLWIAPGGTLNIIVGIAGTGCIISGAAVTGGGSSSVSGQSNYEQTLLGGNGGPSGAAGVGGAGVTGRGTGAGAASVNVVTFGTFVPGPGSGAGASTAGSAGGGGGTQRAGTTSGGGTDGGGGGASNMFEQGQAGSANGVNCTAPVYLGWGGAGGCGGGANANGGNGDKGFAHFSGAW